MKPQKQIRAELHDLLAYYPGRGRASIAWLVLMPILVMVHFPFVFVRVSGMPSNELPVAVVYATGQSALWIYLPAAFVCILRVNHSQRSSLSETGRIILSSVLYGFLLGLPAVVVAAIWSLFYVGLSVASVLHGLFGVIAVCGSVSLLVVILGLAGHYLAFLIPLCLLLMKTYVLYLPILYPMSSVPEHWRTFEILAIPLAPSITIIRNAMLNSTANTPGLCWAGAVLHTIAGLALLLWQWKNITEPEVRQVSST